MTHEPPSEKRDVRAVFEEALERTDPAERFQYLEEVCGSDRHLRQEVEELLEVECAPIEFLPSNPQSKESVQGSSPQADHSSSTESPGTLIGRYKLLEQIGEGGFGVVYMAEQEEPVRRKVALKIIKLGMDNRQVIARFEVERQALAMMDHPNIAKILDAGVTGQESGVNGQGSEVGSGERPTSDLRLLTSGHGRPYFVMELVRGIPITQFCEENRLTINERLQLFIPVCQAIQHAHQKGVIHRDIKPTNVLVTINESVPHPMVIDFGVAKAIDQRLTEKTLYTCFTQMIGTPAYMSPEQAEMSKRDVDTRTDVYSLGILLYELLTGSPPFPEERLREVGYAEIQRIITQEEPVRPSTLLSRLNGRSRAVAASRRCEPASLMKLIKGDLDWIVLKAIDKDRNRRYETANGLAADLQRYLSDEPVAARSPSRVYRAQKFVRRNKLTLTAAAAVVVALGLGMVVSTRQWFLANRERVRAEQAREEEHRQRQLAQEAQRFAETQQLQARRNAYASDMGRIQQALADSNFGRARQLLNRQEPDGNEQDLRGWEWRYLWSLCPNEAQLKLCETESGLHSLSISHDGRWLAIGEMGRGGFSIWDLERRKIVARPPAGDWLVCVGFSPGNPLLAFSGVQPSAEGEPHQRLWLWDAVTEQAVATLPLKAVLYYGHAFSEDGRTLVSQGLDHCIVWKATDDKNALEWKRVAEWPTERKGVIGSCRGFAVNQDCSLAATGWRTLHLMDLSTGQDLWTRSLGEDRLTSVAFSPDGMFLASAGFPGHTVRLWDVASGKELGQPLGDHQKAVTDILFFADGKTLITASMDQTIRLWDVGDPAGARARGRPLMGHNLEVWCLSLSPDERTLISGSKDGEVYVWDLTSQPENRSYLSLPGIHQWCFSPNGRTILTCGLGGQVRSWQGPDFQSGRLVLETFPMATDVRQGACFSEDGRRFASSARGVVHVWDLQTKNLLHQLNVGADSPYPLRFIGQGTRLITVEGEAGVDRLWDLGSARPIHSWTNPPSAGSAAVSLDEKWFLRRSGITAIWSIRDLRDGTETRRELLGLRWPGFSPDGQTAVSSSYGNRISLWNPATWKEERSLPVFLADTTWVGFSKDGRRLITCARAEGLQLWDTENWRDLVALLPENANLGVALESGAFSPDGSLLGALDFQSGRLHLWRAPSWEEIETAEKARARVL